VALVAARLAALALLASLLGGASLVAAEPRTASEADIKAAYLYHFGKFVEWPAETLTRDVFAVCVLRDASFVATFRAQVGQKRIQDKPVDVKLVWRRADAEGCHVLYVGDAREPGDAAPAPRGTLLVADGGGVTGAALAFVPRDDTVRFTADVDAARRAGITLSSQLLKLAVDVAGTPAGGG